MFRADLPHRVRALISIVAVATACGGPADPTAAGQGLSVTITPESAAVGTSTKVTFLATVLGTANTGVTWSLREGAPAAGSITPAGLYSAPATPGTFHVVATSVADPNVSASAPVVVDTVYNLPPSRSTTWAPGVVGGVPNYTTIHATLAAGTGDQRSAIQAALDAAGKAAAGDGIGRVVRLGAGTFNFSGALFVPSRVVLRGAGVNAAGAMQTRIVHAPGNDSAVVLGSTLWPWSEGTSRALTADAVKGASSVSVSSAAGLAAGMLVTVDEITDGPDTGDVLGPDVRSIFNNKRHPLGGGSRGWWCRDNRPMSQVLEIAGVSGNTVTFKTPLHIGFRTAFNAQLVDWTPAVVQLAGVEDLRISGSGDPAAGINGAGVFFSLAKNSWAARVEVDDSFGSAVQWSISHHCTLRDSYLRDAHVIRNGGAGYAVDVTRGSSDNLIENNIIIRFNKVSQYRSSGGGNVFGYNYTDDGGIDVSPDWVETGIQASHYPTPHYELFEGNYSWNADGEFTEGNAIHITFFRNHLSGVLANTPGWLTNGSPKRLASAFFGHRWYNFVGNVMGVPAVDYSGWSADLDQADWSPNSIWRTGFNEYPQFDARVHATQIRDGNFDYKSNAVSWWGLGGAGSTPIKLPGSLYLAGKPAFFGASAWPWVDPTGTTKVFELPAKARFQAGRPNG